MTTFLLLLKCFFWSILSTLLRVVLPSVTILLLKYSFKILFTPLPIRGKQSVVSFYNFYAFNLLLNHIHPYTNMFGKEHRKKR